MLDLLRKKAQSTYIQATVVVIILVFIFWGVGSNNGPGQSEVAKVNDQSITYTDYQQTYDRRVEQIRKQFGGNLPANLLETLGIKEQVINELINRALIQQAAHEMGMLASDEEVSAAIQDMETFKNNGVFDLGWYQQVLTSSRIGVTDFEAGMRSDLITNKVMDQVKKLSRVPAPELEERLAYEFGEKKFSYVSLGGEQFKNEVKITEEGLAAFYDQEKSRYQTEPLVKIKYLVFPFGVDGSAVQIPEETIKKYFTDNIDKFAKPEARRASHILIKFASDDTEEQKEAKKKKAEDLLKKAQAGDDFAKLAKKNSDDSTASNGGDLGFFPRGRMVKPFEESVFGMQEGDISLVETVYGFHVIKLVKIEAAAPPELDKVRSVIVEKLRKEQGKAIAFTQADDAYEKIILSGSLDKYAATANTHVVETEFFDRNTPPASIKGNAQLLNTAFSLKKGEMSSLIEDTTAYAIIYVEDVKAPQIPELATVRAQVEKDYIVAEADKMASEAADKLLAVVKGGTALPEGAKEYKADLHETGFVSRAVSQVEGVPANVISSAMNLSVDNPLPEKPVNGNGRYYVVAFAEARDAADDLKAAKAEELKKQLQQEEEMNLLSAWTAYLKSQADITINKTFL